MPKIGIPDSIVILIPFDLNITAPLGKSYENLFANYLQFM
jgi:hypothetical protein